RKPRAADLARREVVRPAGSREVATDDDLDGKHLEPATLERAAVVAQRDEMVRDEMARPCEPERRQPCEYPSLVGDLGGEDDVERRDAIAGDEHEPVVAERVEVAHLAAAEVQGLRHAPEPVVTPRARAGG